MNLNLQFFGSRGANSASAPDPLLGRQGKPKSADEALANVNKEHYDQETDRNGQYHVNCQRCIFAYEMQRRGYDVEALPAPNSRTDPMFTYSASWERGFIGQKWERNLGKRNPEVEQNIISKMQDWGDGSRAIAYVAWKNGGAHVFNIENQGGKVSIFDAQDGKRYKLSDYLSRTKPSQTELSRVDNLQPNTSVIKHAVKVKGKK